MILWLSKEVYVIFCGLELEGKGVVEMKFKDFVIVNFGNENMIDFKSGM